MLYEGMLEEGLSIVKGVRDRHDGERRNPWNEPECGDNYARAMASWALILALSGYRYSAPEGMLSFSPRLDRGDFRCFFSTGGGWGVFAQRHTPRRRRAVVDVRYGEMELRQLGLDWQDLDASTVERVRARIGSVYFEIETEKTEGGLLVKFGKPVLVRPGRSLVVTVQH